MHQRALGMEPTTDTTVSQLDSQLAERLNLDTEQEAVVVVQSEANWAQRVSDAEQAMEPRQETTAVDAEPANSASVSSDSSQYEDVESSEAQHEAVAGQQQDKHDDAGGDGLAIQPTLQLPKKKKKDPAYAPRTGYYFEHDSRDNVNSDAVSGQGRIIS